MKAIFLETGYICMFVWIIKRIMEKIFIKKTNIALINKVLPSVETLEHGTMKVKNDQ